MNHVEETLSLPQSIEQQDVVYQDRNQKIHKVLARFKGFNKEYFVADHGPRAAIVAVRRGEVLLVRQYRLVINALSYEIPGGRISAGEEPMAAAARECFEESGVQCRHLKPLISYHPGLDICRNYTSVFYTEEVDDANQGDPDRRVWVPLSRGIDMVRTQEILDSLSIIALLAYRLLRTAAGHGA